MKRQKFVSFLTADVSVSFRTEPSFYLAEQVRRSEDLKTYKKGPKTNRIDYKEL
jgi:hypothetical protein